MSPVSRRVVLAGAALTTASLIVPVTVRGSRAYDWKFAGWSGGGAFPNIFPDLGTPNKVWLVSDVASLFVSTDKGENWDWANNGLLNVAGMCFRQSPSNPNIIYFSTGGIIPADVPTGAIHSSADGGQSWTKVADGPGYGTSYWGPRALAVSPIDGNVAFLASYSDSGTGDIMRTTDRVNWSRWVTAAQVGDIGYFSAAEVDKTNTYLWVGGFSGLRRITLADGTVTPFVLAGTGATRNLDIHAVTIAGINYVFVAAGTKIAYTTDHGATWTYTADTNIGNHALNYFDIGIGPTLATTKIMSGWGVNIQEGQGAYQGGRVQSGDGGATWTGPYGGTVRMDLINVPTRTTHGTDGGNAGWLFGISVDPFNSSIWYCTDDWGAYRSDDFGATWFEKIKGAGNVIGTDVKIAPDGSILACSMDDGLLRSADGGQTYNMLIPNTTPGQGWPEVAGDIWRIETFGTAADWNAQRGVCVATNSPWASDFKQQILRSANMGGPGSNTGTWSVLTQTGIPTNYMGSGAWGKGYMRGFCVDPQARGLTNGRIWASLDGYNDTDVPPANGGIFLSTDSGQTFVRKSVDDVNGCDGAGGCWRVFKALAVNPTDSNNIIYATFGSPGSQYTLDGGTTWLPFQSGNNSWIVDLCFGSDGTAYMVGTDSGPSLWRSTDKGANWTMIWNSPLGDQADALRVDPANPDRLVFSVTWSGGGAPNPIYLTTNARADVPTFNDITGNLPNGWGMSGCAFKNSEGPNGTLYCARYAGGIFKVAL